MCVCMFCIFSKCLPLFSYCFLFPICSQCLPLFPYAFIYCSCAFLVFILIFLCFYTFFLLVSSTLKRFSVVMTIQLLGCRSLGPVITVTVVIKVMTVLCRGFSSTEKIRGPGWSPPPMGFGQGFSLLEEIYRGVHKMQILIRELLQECL